MSQEATVLLVEAEMLPNSLEEQLDKRGVFAEHATTKNLDQLLPVVVPDLIVQSGAADLEGTLSALESADPRPPLVVIADRAVLRKLRVDKHPAVKALIPEDLPVAAMAHRLTTLAQRSAEGRSISPPKPKGAPTGTTPRLGDSGPVSSRRGERAPKPLAPEQKVKIVDPDIEARRQAEQEEKERQAVERAEAQQRAVRDEREKKKAEREARAREASAKRRAEMERRAEERKKILDQRRKERERKAKERAEERALRKSQAPQPAQKSDNTPSEVRALDSLFPTETPKPSPTTEEDTAEVPAAPRQAHLARDRKEAEALEQTTQAVDVSAFAPTLDRDAERADSSPPAERRSSRPVESKPASHNDGRSDDFASVRKTEDLSVIAPLPVNMRMDLAPKTDKLPPIRIALLDTDLTRADAIAAALRERGMKIHPVTPNVETTRWPMLRRFAPQGLVVDEKSMARAAADWVETFRGEPFLRHVPVILVRFSRLFDEQSSEVALDPLLHLVEHLGREEFALLDKLAPGRQVDLWLSQIAPYRLVQMLTQEDRNTRLDCKSRTERMVWHLGPGYAGRGKLADLETGEPKKRLSPEESLNWLLSHEDCQVSVHQHIEPLAHASESRDSTDLLREMTVTLEAPKRHESVRPGAVSSAALPEVPTLSSSALVSVESLPGASDSRASTGAAQDPAVQVPARERPPLLSPEQKKKIKESALRARAAIVSGYETYRTKVDEIARPRLGEKLPGPVLSNLHWTVPAVLLLLLVLVVSLVGGDESPTPSAEIASLNSQEADPTEPPPANKQPNAEKDPEAAPDGAEDDKEEKPGNLWIVESDQEQPSCEERLGPATPKREDPIKATGYWKNARRLLMVGDMDQAIENMCLAGLLNPKGPASEGLAEYYLGQRSLGEAQRWIDESLKADPDRRKSRELLADIKNQKGDFDEARKLLLDTMRLSGDETKKMELTARKLRQDARLARKGGDLPRAERKLRRAAMLAPRDAEVAAELGDVLFRRKEPKAAALWAKKSLELDPNYSTAMLLSGRIAEAQGHKDEARRFYEMVPLGDPYHKEAQRRRNLL